MFANFACVYLIRTTMAHGTKDTEETQTPTRI